MNLVFSINKPIVWYFAKKRIK